MSISKFGFEKLKSFLSNDIYYVPKYQRGYSWEEEQVDDFWQDLLQVYNDSENTEHFLGQVVIHNDLEEGKKYIIDGQQRITTSVILCDIFRTELAVFGDVEPEAAYASEDLNAQQIGRISGKRQNQKLYLGESDNDFFFKNIQTQGSIDYDQIKSSKQKLLKSNLNILYASEYFNRAVQAFLATEDGELKKAKKLMRLVELYLEKFNLMSVETTDINEAYIIFETLNARGKDLETSDLLKNHVLRTAGSDMELASRKWTQIIENLGDTDPTKFIRYFWNSRNSHTREKDLYKELRTYVKSPAVVSQLLEDLMELSELFVALQSPEDSKFFELEELNERILEIHKIKATSFYPIILALYSSNNSNSISDKEISINNVLKSIETLLVRNFVVSGKNPNKYEKEFSSIAKMISDGYLKNDDDIIQKIKVLTVNDEEFEANFRLFTSKKNDVIRYLLRKIINHSNTETRIVDNPKKVHVEHILPKKRSADDWKQFSDEEANDLLWRLGNLTLLGQEYNQKASNKAFDKKKQMYLQSDISMTRELAGLSEWDKEAILNRQNQLSKIALNVWK